MSGATDLLIKNLAKTITESPTKKPSAYDTQAEVRRVEGNTAWVHIPGGIDETPVQLTTNAKKGDIVQVRVSGGRAWLYGNASAPPTDDTKANEANNKAVSAHVVAVEAQDTADEANTTAVIAKDTAEAILIYDHTYVITDDIAVFTAYVYQGGVDITSRFSSNYEDYFTWYLKTEDGEHQILPRVGSETTYSNGRYCYVDLKATGTYAVGYGAEIIGYFNTNDDSGLLTNENEALEDISGNILTARTQIEGYVKVRELNSVTPLSTDKLLIVGGNGEGLSPISSITQMAVDAADAYTKSQTDTLLNAKADISDIPTVPTNVSAFINDSNYATETYVDTETSAIQGTLFYGQVDDTSTKTVFTAQISGITEYRDGLAVMLKNGVVTSAAGFTININGLGAKQAYTNMAEATAETTLFNINYTMLFVYDSTRVSGGGWICYRGYDSNTNTVGYQLRTNSSALPASDKFYRYRLLFTSADNTKFVPANTSTSTNATAIRDVNQRPIDPFGRIVYYGTTAAIDANASPSVTALWQQYTFVLGYSFNRTGAALVLTYPAPVYIKCTPQSDGSAIIDSTTPYVQTLPSANDEKIYIFLGMAYSETNIELTLEHPVYCYKDGCIKLWTNEDLVLMALTNEELEEILY